MTKYRVKIHTGPTLVHEIADKLRHVGYVVIEGTEHVLLDSYTICSCSGSGGAIFNILADLCREYKTDFGLRPEVLFQLKS